MTSVSIKIIPHLQRTPLLGVAGQQRRSERERDPVVSIVGIILSTGGNIVWFFSARGANSCVFFKCKCTQFADFGSYQVLEPFALDLLPISGSRSLASQQSPPSCARV